MIPTVDALNAYYGYRDLTESLFKPYIAIVSAPITESYLNYSMSPLERLQPNAGLSFSMNREIFLRESLAITAQQVTSDETDNTPLEEEQRNLAKQRRRLRNRETA
jgi:hypothetical protein